MRSTGIVVVIDVEVVLIVVVVVAVVAVVVVVAVAVVVAVVVVVATVVGVVLTSTHRYNHAGCHTKTSSYYGAEEYHSKKKKNQSDTHTAVAEAQVVHLRSRASTISLDI